MIESAEEFVRLRTSRNPAEYQRAAKESAPDEVWRQIVDRFPDMGIWVVHNKSVPLWVLRELAHSEAEEIREAVAMKRKLDPDLFTALASDSSDSVRHFIARNQKAPPEVLERLSMDESPKVREAAAIRLVD